MTEREEFEKWASGWSWGIDEGDTWAAWQAAAQLYKPRWIPVEERLPEVETSVLVTDGVQVVLAWLVFDPEDGTCWDDHLATYDDVTHWMPLPEVPK